MATITTKQEGPRGCGYRKGGGMYLVNDGPGRSCGRMPIPLHVCPTCSNGIKPARGWTWIDGKAVLAAAPACKYLVFALDLDPRMSAIVADMKAYGAAAPAACMGCSMNGEHENRVGLMWVGGKFYPEPEDFVKEAQRLGLSKRISQIPKELVVGKTWVWLAHREVMPAQHTTIPPDGVEDCPLVNPEPAPDAVCRCGAERTPGVFHAFVPTRIEYIVKGTESEAELDALEKRGLSLVKVERLGEDGQVLEDVGKDDDEEN